MRMHQVSPLTAAILLSVLCMGLVGVLVVLPIACIQWTWNAFIVSFSPLPQINPWQAGLLYLAFATLLYLMGFVEVRVEAGNAD